jgi:hypothetical protein
MRNFKLLLIAVFCIGSISCINGQIRKTVYGNGNVVKKERKAGEFAGIRVSSGIDVYLKQADHESISVESDENL